MPSPTGYIRRPLPQDHRRLPSPRLRVTTQSPHRLRANDAAHCFAPPSPATDALPPPPTLPRISAAPPAVTPTPSAIFRASCHRLRSPQTPSHSTASHHPESLPISAVSLRPLRPLSKHCREPCPLFPAGSHPEAPVVRLPAFTSDLLAVLCSARTIVSIPQPEYV